MGTLQVRLFGRLSISHDGRDIELPAKAEELLCYLLLHRVRPQTRESLATVLWGNATTAQSKKYLRQTLWQLHQAIEGQAVGPPPLLRPERDWVAIDESAEISVDAYEFDDACAPLANLGAGPLDVARAEAAEDLYRGELLEGQYHEWCLVERERYQTLYGLLLEHLLDHRASQGEFPTAIAYGLRLLGLEPSRERTHRCLMRLYALSGDRGAALSQFARCSAILDHEFGVGPATATLALAAQIRAGELDGGALELGASLAAEIVHLRACVETLQGEVAHLRRSLDHTA
jgi:DNA-binding SARP family transcriptional activator